MRSDIISASGLFLFHHSNLISNRKLYRIRELVRSERTHGFVTSTHGEVPLFLYGKVDTVGKWLGYDEGNIYIPAHLGTLYRLKAMAPKRVLSMLGDLFEARTSLRDVVRHEYGHAVAHWYPRLIQHSTRFKETFGGSYWREDHRDAEDPNDFVSDYAMTMPKEDFAETFMHYLRHGGELPRKFMTPAIRRKWKFVRDLGRVVRNGESKW